jgi:gamma-glutamylputrescine oxidase
VDLRELPVEALEQLEAEQVVIATDGYTRGLLPELDEVVRPVRGQVLVTEPLGRELFPCPHYARHGYDYWQQTPERRLVVGGFRDKAPDLEQTGEERTTRLIQGHLERFAAELTNEQPRIAHHWDGLFGVTQDRLSLAGQIPGREGVWVACGYSGHGNVLGPRVRRARRERDPGRPPPELDLFDPSRLLA